MPGTRPRGLAKSMSSLVVLVFGLLGFHDVLWNGAGLSNGLAVATEVLWLTGGLTVALGVFVALWVVEGPLLRRVPGDIVASGAAAVVLQTATLLAHRGGLVGTPLALALALATTVALAVGLARRIDPRDFEPHMGAAVAALIALCLLTPWLRVVLPRTLIALLGLTLLLGVFAFGGRRPRLLSLARGGAIGFVGAALVLLALDPSRDPEPGTPFAAAPGRPHVVLIVLDTQRADYLGAYGHTGGLTPNLDALAQASTLYEHCFAAANWTVPAHASLFTGLYPQTHGASFEHHRYLDDRFETLAEGLASAGYATRAFVANEYVKLAHLDQGFEQFEEVGAPFTQLALRGALQVLGVPARFVDHGVVDAVDRIARRLGERDPADTRPVFLFVNLLEPHWRYFPPLADRLAELGARGSVDATIASTRFYGPTAMAAGVDDAETRAAIRGLYAAAVRHQDEHLGRLLAVIDASLPAEDTLLIVTNDHGENLGEGGRWDHVFAVNDHLVHAPLLIRHPRFPAGAREPGLCSHVDIPATIGALVDGYAPHGADDARSLVPDGFEPREQVFVAGDPYLGHLERMGGAAGLAVDSARWNRSLRGVRDLRFKYVESSRGGAHLYDLDADPDETRDASAAHPEAAARLRAVLHDFEAQLPAYVEAPAAGDGGGPMSPEALEQLRSLGYAE